MIFSLPIQPIPRVEELYWCKKHGLHKHFPPSLMATPAGTYHRMADGRWRVRVKKRTNGLTWKLLSPKDPMLARMQVEALLMGVSI